MLRSVFGHDGVQGFNHDVFVIDNRGQPPDDDALVSGVGFARARAVNELEVAGRLETHLGLSSDVVEFVASLEAMDVYPAVKVGEMHRGHVRMAVGVDGGQMADRGLGQQFLNLVCRQRMGSHALLHRVALEGRVRSKRTGKELIRHVQRRSFELGGAW